MLVLVALDIVCLGIMLIVALYSRPPWQEKAKGSGVRESAVRLAFFLASAGILILITEIGVIVRVLKFSYSEEILSKAASLGMEIWIFIPLVVAAGIYAVCYFLATTAITGCVAGAYLPNISFQKRRQLQYFFGILVPLMMLGFHLLIFIERP